jgi:Mg2+ and Co2+ transporter CorA
MDLATQAIGPHVPFDPSSLLPAPGLVFAFSFDETGEPNRWPRDKPLEFENQHWLWAHFNLADARSHAWLEARAELSRDARQLLTSPDEHPHVFEREGEVFGVYTDLVHDLSGPTEEICGLHFLLKERLLLTARRRSLQGPDSARAALEGGLKIASPPTLFDYIIACSADGFDEIVERLTGDLDKVEDQLILDVITDEQQRLGQVRRTAVRLHRPLAGLRRTMHRMRSRASFGESKFAAALLSQRLETSEHDLDTIQARARLMQDEINAKIGTETNRQVFTLSILTALFVPATLVTGLFGMNVSGLPFTDGTSGFQLALASSVAASLAVCFILWKFGVLRRR